MPAVALRTNSNSNTAAIPVRALLAQKMQDSIIALTSSERRFLDQLAEEVRNCAAAGSVNSPFPQSIMCSTVFDSRQAAQHLCQGNSRCTPAGISINKCTSAVAPSNGASCNKNQLKLLPGSTSIAPGTGIFFSQSECNSTSEFSIYRLVHLATVACDSEESDLPHAGSNSRRLTALLKPGKAIKKRRTPRRNQSKTFDSKLHIPELEMPTAGPWSTLYSTAQSPTQTCQENENSNDNSKPTRIMGECETVMVSCELASASGEPSSLTLTGGNQSTILENAGPSKSPANKKGRRKPETRVERYARTILKFVGAGTVPEKLIRLTLGNNPDTSKALRLLLSHKKLKRLGEGGKGSAYLYLATALGLEEFEQMTAQEQGTCQVQEA